MPNLKEPITSLAVVRHTLETTQKCAEECHQEYGVVTYDLNAAKPAMQIQATESPRLTRVHHVGCLSDITPELSQRRIQRVK